MKIKNVRLLILLLAGLFFSTAGFKFNLTHGFEYNGFWISLPIQILDVALFRSSDLNLNSQFIGYLFYLAFGLTCLKRYDLKIKTDLTLFVLFFALIGLVFLSDFYSIYQDFNNQFEGRHFRISFIVFLFGFVLYQKLSRFNSKNILKTDTYGIK